MAPVDYSRARAVTSHLEERLIASLRGDPVSRRTVLGGLALAAGAGAAGTAGGHTGAGDGGQSTHGLFGAVGEYGGNQIDPHEFLRSFETGEVVGTDGEGRRVREFDLDAASERAAIDAENVRFGE